MPDNEQLDIPAVLVTGSLGKTTTCRMIAAILTRAGKLPGLTTTEGCWIGGSLLREGDSSNSRWAHLVASDGRADCAVFEMARGGLVRLGIGFSGYDVGVATCVLDNHLGLDGIHTREQMAQVKGAVIENARRYAVLNADDRLCLEMSCRAKAERILVSRRPDNAALQRHAESGGLGIHLTTSDSQEVALTKGNKVLGKIRTRDIPATFGGVFFPACINACFAAASAHALGIEFRHIRDALTDFKSNAADNPGRLNYFPQHVPRLFLTWADGPQACAEVHRLLVTMKDHRCKRLVISAMGNRQNAFIRESGRALAGSCQDYICCDWQDLRGRPAGEVASLLAEGLREGGVPASAISKIPHHDNAVGSALASAHPCDLVAVVSYSSARIGKSLGLAASAAET